MIEGTDVATKNKVMLCLTAIALIGSLISSALASVVQPSDDFWYLDQANVLSLETEGEIFFANQRLYDACGAEIVVAAIDSTDGMAIEDYAYTLFNDWEIGGSKYLGFLLLMAIEDEDYYAMPGTMMGSYIDSATISEMLVKYLEPDFAKGNYDEGARLFFEAVYNETVDVLNLNLSIEDAKKEYTDFIREENSEETHTAVQNEPAERHSTAQDGVSMGAVILIIVLLIMLSRSTRRFHRRSSMFTNVPPMRGYSTARSRSNASSMMRGYILGRMMSSARNSRSFVAPRNMHGGMHRPPSGSSFGGFSARNPGSGRSSSPRSFSGGFGGASRSGSASRGPSTRGGGSGRFSRK